MVAVAVDVGQGGEDLEDIRKRALACGAVEAVVADARDEFAEEYCLPALQANALYMDRYPLVSALSRPLIVKHLVEAAKDHGASDGRARLHRQGQRPGAVRGRRRRARARPVGDRARPRLRAGPARRRSPTPRSAGCRSTSRRSRRTRSTRTSGAARWRPGSSRTSGTRPTEDVYAYTGDPPRSSRPQTRSWSRSRPACRSRSTAGRSRVLQAIQELNAAAPARTASGGSTWSRTGSSASRAARSTRRPARSR